MPNTKGYSAKSRKPWTGHGQVNSKTHFRFRLMFFKSLPGELKTKVKACYPVISRLFPSLWKLRYYCSISAVPRAPLCCTSIINFPNRNLKPSHISAFPFSLLPKCSAMFRMRHLDGFPNKGREGDNIAEGCDTIGPLLKTWGSIQI